MRRYFVCRAKQMRNAAYWARRQKQMWQALDASEQSLVARLDKLYTQETARLEKEIAAYYAMYGRDGVLQYRTLLEQLPEADKRLLMERLEDFSTKYPQYTDVLPVRQSIYKLDRLEGLRANIYLQQLKLGAQENALVGQHLAAAAQRAASTAAGLLGIGQYNANIAALVTEMRWVDGKSFSSRIWDNRKKLAAYLQKDFGAAVARGDSYERCAKALCERFAHVSKKSARALIYTEGAFVTNEVNARIFEDAYEMYTVSSVQDARTCDICHGMNGQTFRFKDRRPGENFPPFHTRCRCTFTVVTVTLPKGRAGGTMDAEDGAAGEMRLVSHLDPASRNAVRQELDDFVKQYEGADVEHMRVITANGDVYEIQGGAARIEYEERDLPLLRGATTIHNHPAGASQYSFSGSLPDEDIPSFLAEQGAVMEAFDELYRYRFTRPENVTPEQWAEAYYLARQNVFMRMEREGYSIDDPKTGEDAQHWKIKLTCEILGIESCYERWAR